jgi:hypothetical protein
MFSWFVFPNFIPTRCFLKLTTPAKEFLAKARCRKCGGFMDFANSEDDYDDGYKYKLNAFSATVGIVF